MTKLRNINALIFCFILLFLSACSSREMLLDYQRGDSLLPDEAVGVFRVVNAENKKASSGIGSLFNPHYEIGLDINKFLTNKWISLRSNGYLDDADSSEIRVVRMPSGLYDLRKAYVLGTASFQWTYSSSFDVFPGEVVYIGDIVISSQKSDVLFLNNYAAVRRQLKKHYPELADKLVIRGVDYYRDLKEKCIAEGVRRALEEKFFD